MRRPTRGLFGLPILLALPGAAFGQAASAERHDPEALCRAAVDAFREHLNRFTFYSCRFTLTAAEAASVWDARNSKWTFAAVVARGRVVRRGKQVLHEQDGGPFADPNAAAVGHPSTNAWPTFLTRYELDDGEYLVASHPRGDVRLDRPKGRRSSNVPDPLEFVAGDSHWSNGLDAKLRSPDEFTFEPVGAAKWRDRPVVALRFRSNGSDQVDRVWLDPATGYLPVRSLTSVTNPIGHQVQIEAIVTETRACPGQRWFPTVLTSSQSWSPRVWRVFEFRVTELDVEHPPADGDFAITIPAGKKVFGDNDPTRVLTLPSATTVTLRDLPGLFREWEATPSGLPVADDAPPPLEEPSAWWAAGGAAAVFCLLAVLRRRGHTRRPSRRPIARRE